MELRIMSTAEERQLFARNLIETRLARGAGFCETGRSHVGEVHLAFGRLYGLFEDESSQLDEMLSGFVVHDLATFPQSYPKPDLTHLPPESVLEIGELWAKVAGSASITRQAARILAGELKAQAILVYPIFSPWNLSASYNGDFERVGSPIEWPYAKTLDGENILVQAMVSTGEKLAQMVSEARQWGFSAAPDQSRITFQTPFRVSRRSSTRRRATRQGLDLPSVASA